MKIAYLVPNILISLTEARRREELLNKWAFQGTRVDFITFDEGPSTIESRYEEIISIPNMAKRVKELEDEGYDAAIIGCAEDPGLEVLRELTTKMLIIGPGQTSMLIAASLGSRFSTISTNVFNIQKWYELAYRAGVLAKLYSVRPLGLPVADFHQSNKEVIISKIVGLAEEEQKKGNIDVIVLGCLSLGYLEITNDIEKATGLSVINSPFAALKYSEALVGCGLIHSKIAYPTPSRMENFNSQISLDEFIVTRSK